MKFRIRKTYKNLFSKNSFLQNFQKIKCLNELDPSFSNWIKFVFTP